jgi:flagellar hook-length control protein FliK
VVKPGAQIALTPSAQKGAKTRGKAAQVTLRPAAAAGQAGSAAPVRRLPAQPFARILEEKQPEKTAQKRQPVAAELPARPAALRTPRGDAKPEAAEVEKELRDILEDPRLSARQKAARAKLLLAEARDAAALVAGDTRTVHSNGGAKKAWDAPASVAAVAPRADAPVKAAEPRVFVWDLRRKQEEKPSASTQAAHAGGKTVAATEKEPSGLAPALQGAARETHGQAHSARAPEAPAPTVPQTPLERLREMAGSELSRAAGIILRDGGSGEIRLVLKPDSLGSVRVRLNMTDNVLDGKIIVDNPAVKRILEGSIDSLTRALTADGFQTASLQVSVGGGDGKPARDDREVPALRRIESARGFSGALPDAGVESWGDLLVNLFA